MIIEDPNGRWNTIWVDFCRRNVRQPMGGIQRRILIIDLRHGLFVLSLGR